MDYNITYRQKDKGWQFIISYKLNGIWKQKSKQGFKTKKDAKPVAEKTLLDLKKSLKASNKIINPNFDILTLNDLLDLFVENSKLYKEESTIAGYTFIRPTFYRLVDMKVKDIKKNDIQSCVDELLTTGIKVSSIRSYLTRLKQLFIYYISNYNGSYELPTKDIILPSEKTKSTKKALSKSELDALLKKLETNRYYSIALLAGECGLRRGEILGLTWDDIDEGNLTINVHRQWKKQLDGTFGFGPLKTKNSNRTIPISESTLKKLKNHKSETDIHNRIASFNDESVSKYLNDELRALANISLHELRHTYATILIANGIDFKTAAKLLGHNVEQTMKIYSHVTDDMIDNASKAINKIF